MKKLFVILALNEMGIFVECKESPFAVLRMVFTAARNMRLLVKHIFPFPCISVMYSDKATTRSKRNGLFSQKQNVSFNGG